MPARPAPARRSPDRARSPRCARCSSPVGTHHPRVTRARTLRPARRGGSCRPGLPCTVRGRESCRPKSSPPSARLGSATTCRRSGPSECVRRARSRCRSDISPPASRALRRTPSSSAHGTDTRAARSRTGRRSSTPACRSPPSRRPVGPARRARSAPPASAPHRPSASRRESRAVPVHRHGTSARTRRGSSRRASGRRGPHAAAPPPRASGSGAV